MGYNTPVLLLNDGMQDIANDPEVGKKLAQASATAHLYGRPIDVAAGSHTNCISVLPSSHADVVQVIAFGGNHTSVLGRFMNGGNHYNHDDQVKLIKDLADQYGYRLVKKSGT